MNDPTDEELDAAVAKVIGWHRTKYGTFRESPVRPTNSWDALMAAVWKLRDDGWQFDKDGQDECWRVRNVSHRNYPTFEFCWLDCQGIEAEARALALTIKAVVDANNTD